MDDLINDFLEFYRDGKHARPQTLYLYGLAIKRLFKRFDNQPAEDFTTEMINRWVGEQKLEGYAINTRRLNQAAVRMFFKWYLEHRNGEMLDPCDAMVPLREEKKIPNVPSPEDVMRLVYACDVTKFIGRRDAAIICLLADTGIRVSEIAALRVENVSVKDKHFVLNVPSIKSRNRIIPFCRLKETSMVAEYWANYWQEIILVERYGPRYPLFMTNGISVGGTVMKTAGHRFALRRANIRAGFGEKDVTPHSLRHFFATYSYLNGVDIVEVSKMMGHALIETTMRYIHIAQVISGDILAKNATSNLKAPREMHGFVKIYNKIR